MQGHLFVDENFNLNIAVCNSTNRMLYSIRVIALQVNEITLSGGRFKSYHRLTQQYSISVPQPGLITHHSEELFDWIATHVPTPWSLRVQFLYDTHEPMPYFTFSFDDDVAAGYFGLRWL